MAQPPENSHEHHQRLEQEQVTSSSPARTSRISGPGDTVRVNVKVVEGERTRVQAYEGVCIARAGGGLNENFTVRKISYGEGVERVFPLYSPMINSIEVVRRGKVRRAKLYYLRGRRGKSARIAEKQDHTGPARRDAAESINCMPASSGLRSQPPAQSHAAVPSVGRRFRLRRNDAARRTTPAPPS